MTRNKTIAVLNLRYRWDQLQFEFEFEIEILTGTTPIGLRELNLCKAKAKANFVNEDVGNEKLKHASEKATCNDICLVSLLRLVENVTYR